MDIKPFQSCKTNEGWVPVQVASESQNLDYTVMVCPWGTARESICECPGYTYRGQCKHQQIALDSLCRWDELTGPEAQTEFQKKTNTCPRCGGPTKYEMTLE